MTEERIKEWLETHEPTVDDTMQLLTEALEEGIEKMRDKNKRVQEELNECRSKVAQMAVEKKYGQKHNG